MTVDDVMTKAENGEFNPDEWKYWLTFTESKDGGEYLYHAIGYVEEPNEESIAHAYEEVRNDPEFGMGDSIDEMEVNLLKPGPEADALVEFLKSNPDDQE